MESLAHLGPPVIHEDCPVFVNQHEGTGLIEEGGSERDAEFHGGHRNPLLEEFIRSIEFVHGLSSSEVFRRLHELFINRLQPVMLDGLAVVRDIVSA